MNDLTDLEAEHAVLSGLIKHGYDTYVDVIDMVVADSFTNLQNQVLFKCISYVLSETKVVDLPSIMSASNTLGYGSFFEKPESRALFRTIGNMHVDKHNVRNLAAKIKKLQIARTLSMQLEKTRQDLSLIRGDEKLFHILGIAEKPIFDLTSSLAEQPEEPRPIFKNIKEYVQYLKDNPVKQMGISTGYSVWDRAIGGGLRKRTVNLIGARPKSGKTIQIDNMAIHIARNKIPFLMLDTEMGEEEHRIRMLAMLSGVAIDDIETGQFGGDREKCLRIDKASEILDSIPYHYISIAGQPFEETLAMMRRWIYRLGLKDGKAKECVIGMDYLKLMSSEAISGNLAEFQVLGFMITSLHNFMVRYDVPCVSMVQLNRDGITREDTDVASGSDRLIWLCTNFSILKRQSDEEIANQTGNKVVYTRKLLPIVSRHGPCLDDNDYINLHFEGKYARLTEGPTRHQLEKVKDKKSNGFDVDSDSKDGGIDTHF